jgi:general secretion pathway protein A
MKPNLEVVGGIPGQGAVSAIDGADVVTQPLPLPAPVWQAHHALGMSRNPFPPTPDAQGYFFTESLSGDFAETLHCIRSRKGFVLITGEVGLGKSTFVRNLMDTLAQENTAVSLVLNTFLQGGALLAAINDDFGLHQDANAAPAITTQANLAVQLTRLNAFLLECAAIRKNCVLIIDDAQNLNHQSLELVRLLCNVETGQEKLLQIVLVGQPELLETLNEPSLRQLKSRIVKHVQLVGLNVTDVARYVDYRMIQSGLGADAAAGEFKQIHLRPEAVTTLFSATLGNPRRLNLVMDRCLYGLVATRSRVVTPDLVRAGVAETTVSGAVATEAASSTASANLAGALRHYFVPRASILVALSIAVPALLLASWSVWRDQTRTPSNGVAHAMATSIPATATATATTPLQQSAPQPQPQPQPPQALPLALATKLSAPATATPVAVAAPVKVDVRLADCAARLAQATPAAQPSAVPQPFVAEAFLQRVYLQPIAFGATSSVMQHAKLLEQRNLACVLTQGDVPLLLWNKTAASEQIRGTQPNAALQDMQRHLQQLGLLPIGRIDGWFGPITQTALKQFQAKFNLPLSGEPDALTILLLENFHG